MGGGGGGGRLMLIFSLNLIFLLIFVKEEESGGGGGGNTVVIVSNNVGFFRLSVVPQMFTAVPGQEVGGYACDRAITKATDGRYLATIAVQTADVTLTQDEGHPGIAAGMPLNLDMAPAMYHGAWPIHKGRQEVTKTGRVTEACRVTDS